MSEGRDSSNEQHAHVTAEATESVEKVEKKSDVISSEPGSAQTSSEDAKPIELPVNENKMENEGVESVIASLKDCQLDQGDVDKNKQEHSIPTVQASDNRNPVIVNASSIAAEQEQQKEHSAPTASSAQAGTKDESVVPPSNATATASPENITAVETAKPAEEIPVVKTREDVSPADQIYHVGNVFDCNLE
jgi:hypothetical protein